MEINDRYDGTNSPFQGDRVLRLATIPAGARIRRATAMITPVNKAGATNPFAETITFTDASEKWWRHEVNRSARER